MVSDSEQIIKTLNQVERNNELENRIDRALKELSEFSEWLRKTCNDKSYAWFYNKSLAVIKIKKILRGQEEPHDG